jgi:hypothetical protein
MAIGGYFINGYCWLLLVILLMAIGGYSIITIGGYFINGYCWLLLAILLMVIWWLFY